MHLISCGIVATPQRDAQLSLDLNWILSQITTAVQIFESEAAGAVLRGPDELRNVADHAIQAVG